MGKIYFGCQNIQQQEGYLIIGREDYFIKFAYTS